ncbi:MAG: GH36-type glycosyl hydrolase domain-containing protein [Candidatus Hermodarchaeota archaeon]
MKYGYFNDIQREYVITRPDTPLPWINYLGCESYFGIISNTAGGFSFYKDARFRRITRYRYNNVPTDFGGRYIYIRDNQSSEFWSPTWQPTRRKLDQYTCQHGLGYTIIKSTYKNIEARICYFVPIGDNLEIWKLTLKNVGKDSRDLSLFSCIEFCLWDAKDDNTNFQRNLNIGEIEVENGVIYHKTEYRERRNHYAFFACSEPIEGFDTRREAFLGPYKGWESPVVVEQGKSSNSKALGWSPIGSHHIKFTIDSGETKQIIFILGYHENDANNKFDSIGSPKINKESVKKVLTKYLNLINIENAFNTLRIYWDNLLSKLKINTPDIHTNRMVNIWNPYQCMITFKLYRSVSLFESGISRGIGFRDSNQDLLSFIQIASNQTRERILNLASTQLKTGGAYHQYQPLTREGNHSIGSDFNDDPLWLVLSVAAYLKETGDWNILDEQLPFENEIGTEQSLLKHLEYSLHYIHERLGPHDLPLIGRADWNDCLNLNCFSENPDQSFQTTKNKDGKVAESMFIAALFVKASKEYAKILEHMKLIDESKKHTEWAEKMSSTMLKFGWDGEWFIRAYDDSGKKVGSKECEEGQIYIETQGFCVFAEVGIKEGLAEKALSSVRDKLATQHGIMLLQPPYTKYYLNLGEISSYPPGYKENGSIFCHSNPWIMIAEAMVGNGDLAHEYYININPSARETISDVHRCEPYVYAQMIAGKDAPNFGEAKNSWLTGPAAWNYIAITNYILGIRPVYNGLCISPTFPKSWQGFKATRIFRNVKFEISVERVGNGNSSKIYVDGKKITGNIVPLPPLESKKEMYIDVKIS